VGGFNAAFIEHGFVDTGGSFTTIDVPGAVGTTAYGINDSGQIVGYTIRSGRGGGPDQGFLATPVATPEPPSLLTLATCIVALFGIASHRRRASDGRRPSA
jgi:hypothetical protein